MKVALTLNTIFSIFWYAWLIFLGYCTGRQITYWQRKRRVLRRQPPEIQVLYRFKRRFEHRMDLWILLHPRATPEDTMEKAHEMALRSLRAAHVEVYEITGKCAVASCEDGWVVRTSDDSFFPERVPCSVCKRQTDGAESRVS
jgi:hypothetical protein